MSLQVVLSTPILVKETKSILEQSGVLSAVHKIYKEGDRFVLTTNTSDLNKIPQLVRDLPNVQIQIITSTSDKELAKDKSIESFTKHKLSQIDLDKDEFNILISQLPRKWTLYPPLLLINNYNTFESIEWIKIFTKNKIDKQEFFTELLRYCFGPNITHIAINKPIIEQDVMRRPFALIPIHGDFGPEPTHSSYENPLDEDFKNAFWCSVVQNGIHQTWAPRYTMFSRGNIKEKKRILDSFTNVKGNSVLDLYAGIGYFTLSYLRLGAKHVFCFELNPWSIEGLIRGVVANGFKYKLIKHEEEFEFDPEVEVFIFHESNEFAELRLKQVRCKLPITHINLGLLPSSKASWVIAARIFAQFSAALTCDIHIHENVHVRDLEAFLDVTSSELLRITPYEDIMVSPLHLEKIKTFAPDVWHICGDFKLISNTFDA